MTLTAYQAHMKRELKGKMAGKTAAQRKAIFRAAAASYKKKPSTRSRVSKAVARVKASRGSSKPKSTGGKRTMGKGGFNTSKIFKWVRVGALALPAVTTLMKPISNEAKLNYIKSDYFGIGPDGKFSWSRLGAGWTPFIAATVVTYGVPKIGSIIRSLVK